MDWLDIDSRINNAVNKVDDMANRRIRQLSDVMDEKIEAIRELLNGIDLKYGGTIGLSAHQVKKPEEFNPPPKE